jgi:hypothetical protein
VTVLWLCFLLCIPPSTAQSPPVVSADASENAALMDRLVKAYPDFLKGIEGNDIVLTDGKHIPFDDFIRDKPFETLLNSPSLRDEFSMPYPKGPPQGVPPLNFDPGRIRYEPFFKKMYGDCEKGEVEPKLVDLAWLPKHGGGRLKVTSVNGVDKKLEAVSAELDELPQEDMKYLIPSAGAYNCRPIAGTSRKSMHAYAAAIDISTKFSDYWLNFKAVQGQYIYKNSIPYEIVAIFEKHGFIWGGRWYHFDTMHFEYRPEILAPAE